MTWSPEINVMLAPRRAYAEAVRVNSSSSAWQAARAPLFVALVQGVAIATVSTHTVAAPLVFSATLCWSTAVAVQVLAALLLIRSAPARAVGMGRALDLFFLGHAPWSLWLLAATAALTWPTSVGGLPWIALIAMVVPAALTARIVAAFSEVVLGAPRTGAVLRATVHQAAIWVVLMAFLATAVQLWPRVIAMLDR